jgi:hypothetical protein
MLHLCRLDRNRVNVVQFGWKDALRTKDASFALLGRPLRRVQALGSLTSMTIDASERLLAFRLII